MKTQKSLLLTLTMALCTVFAFAQPWSTTEIGTNVATTAHNFGSNNPNIPYQFATSVTPGDGNGMCAVCHTPHTGGTTLPLWDHGISATPTFTIYSSPTETLNGTITQPSGASQLCLGCHDGTANMDNYGKTLTAGNTVALIDGRPGDFGINLGDDHPISITYPADAATALAQQMVDPASVGAGYLYAGRVECASCHSLHNPDVDIKLLRSTNDNSALCLKCHIK